MNQPRIPLTQFPCHPSPASFDKRFGQGNWGQGNGDLTKGMGTREFGENNCLHRVYSVQVYARERWIDYLIPCRFGSFNEGFSSQIGF